MPKEIIFTFETPDQQKKFFSQLDLMTDAINTYRVDAQNSVDTKEFVPPKEFEAFKTAMHGALREIALMFDEPVKGQT